MSLYSIIEGTADGPIVLLNSLEGPGPEDDWMLGSRFIAAVQAPIEVTAKEGFDVGTLLPYYTSTPLMRRDLYDAIRSAGVDNLDTWQAVIRRADGSLLHEDYVAFNLLGVVRAADLGGTQFAPENPSRMLDASIESLAVNDAAARGLLMFRLAEYIGAVLVHARVREAIVARSIANVRFTDPSSYLS